MGLPDDQIYDATLAVNELAANVYTHVLTRTHPATAPDHPAAGSGAAPAEPGSSIAVPGASPAASGLSDTAPGVPPTAPDPSIAALGAPPATPGPAIAAAGVSPAVSAPSMATSGVLSGTPGLPGTPGPSPAGAPELWLYRRGQNEHTQLVCKVFDPQREPQSRIPSQVTPAHEFQEHGRGLTIVKNLAANWGCHLTRSRLGGRRSIPGKAVWFAMPVPPSATRLAPPRITPAQAAGALQCMLTARGIVGITRSDAWGESTLVIRNTVKVRCQNATFTWTANGFAAHYALCDITETAEQLVRLHEELSVGMGDLPPMRKT